jgi:hypothetical protein
MRVRGGFVLTLTVAATTALSIPHAATAARSTDWFVGTVTARAPVSVQASFDWAAQRRGDGPLVYGVSVAVANAPIDDRYDFAYTVYRDAGKG